jgi:hypothetical protein
MGDFAPPPNTSQHETSTVEENYEQRQPLSFARRLLRGFGITLVIVAIILGVYGIVAYLAWQRGQTIRVENTQQALREQIANQIELARGDIDNGNFALATRRLDWVLERDPSSEEAQNLQDEAQSGLNARLTPTPNLSPSPTPETSETPDDPADPGQASTEAAFTNLETLMDEGKWEEAVSAIALFQRDFPNQRRQQTDEMLYNAYINLGVKLVSGTQSELGLFYLGQAEQLGDLPLEIEDQRTWAELYLEGIGYYDVNWEITIFYFRGLCSAAPFYQDACQKLYEAYVAFGDQYALALDWCPAEEWYIEAVRLDNISEVVDKRREASTNCLEATPTPDAPITGTLPITNTAPITNSSPVTNTAPILSPTETADPQ